MMLFKLSLLFFVLATIHFSSTNGDETRDAVIAVAKVLKQAFGLAVPGASQALGVADLLTNIINTANGIGIKKGDLWTQIEDKVAVVVGEGLTNFHLSNVRSDFRLMTLKISKGKSFTKDDLHVIMAKKLRMIPQGYKDLAFSSQFATLLSAWTTYMVTGHLELITRNVIPKCSLGNELTSLRDVAVNAAKSLFQKRFRDLKGTNFYRGSPNGGCAGQGIPCRSMARFVFTDSARKTNYDNVVGSILYTATDAIERDTHKLVMKLLIGPINAFFKSEICGKGCPCPKVITAKEVDFQYPYNCFGASKGRPCSLPCQTYGSTYTWCPAYRFGFPTNNLMTGSDWQYCTKADFLQCMPVSDRAFL